MILPLRPAAAASPASSFTLHYHVHCVARTRLSGRARRIPDFFCTGRNHCITSTSAFLLAGLGRHSSLSVAATSGGLDGTDLCVALALTFDYLACGCIWGVATGSAPALML